MKKRIISGIIIAIILLPCIIFGSYYLFALAMFLMLASMYELLNIKKQNGQKYPLYFKIISYILITVLTLGLPFDIFKYSFDFNSFAYAYFGIDLLFLFISLFINFAIAIFDARINLKDVLLLSLMEIIISFAIKALLFLRGQNTLGLYLVGYGILVTISSDIFAYFGGMMAYKLLPKVHKLNERISPKKTIEGSISGTIFGGLCSLLFIFLVNPLLEHSLPIWLIILMSLGLSIVSQIGDLVFSLIKRDYNIKDYSNLIPGHGGILDRIDSLSFVLIISATMLSLLGVL